MPLYNHICSLDLKETGRDVLAALRKESLDIYNRLHSIEEDIGFVNHVHAYYSKFPLLPNLRCGAWYVDPTRAGDIPAYFKSMDGHTNNWCFNLRRANLHIIPLIAEKGGILLVDSTRSGKRMPDALSKTVPIWCTVINRAITIRRHRSENPQDHEWDADLYTPPGVVSAQEHDQITRRLNEWAKDLADSSFSLPLDLQASLRPVWITPSTTSFPEFDRNSVSPAFLPIICICASKQVGAGTERREAGYVYVQGSGDDHELWGMGLTPQHFWRHRGDLMSSPRGDLEISIERVLSPLSPSAPPRLFEANPPPTPIQKIGGRILLASFSSPGLSAILAVQNPKMAYVVLSLSSPSNAEEPESHLRAPSTPGSILHIQVGGKAKAKSDVFFFERVLPNATPFIQSHLSSNTSNAVCITEDCGNDPGTRLDLSVGVALVAVQLLFGEGGEWLGGGNSLQADKKSIRTRLEWIISSEPRSNPSRATLKRVNEFLLTPNRHRTRS